MLLEEVMHSLEMICEAQLEFGKNKNRGQIVFLGGGAGSGKGFAASNFMDVKKFKVRDVDVWKKALLKIAKLKNKYPEIRDLKLSNIADVSTLHDFVKEKGIKEKTLELLLRDVKKGNLPNIMFDITAKSLSDITKIIPMLTDVGYDTKDIHLVWILANFDVALERNANRERRVDPKMVFTTHKGAAITMTSIFNGKTSIFGSNGLDGSATVILNNSEETLFWTTDRNAPGVRGDAKDTDFAYVKGSGKLSGDKGKSSAVDDRGYQLNKDGKRIKLVKNFSKLRMKAPGKPLVTDKKMIDILKTWVLDNVPKEVRNELLGK